MHWGEVFAARAVEVKLLTDSPASDRVIATAAAAFVVMLRYRAANLGPCISMGCSFITGGIRRQSQASLLLTYPDTLFPLERGEGTISGWHEAARALAATTRDGVRWTGCLCRLACTDTPDHGSGPLEKSYTPPSHRSPAACDNLGRAEFDYGGVLTEHECPS